MTYVGDCASALFRIPGAIRRSLHPASERKARKLHAQLKFVRGNLRLLDYALPFVGAVLVWVHSDRAPLAPMVTMLAVVVLACVINEGILLRSRKRRREPIPRALSSARVSTFATLLLMGSWSTFALSTWVPPANNLFTLLILSCSLAVVTTMLSVHAATAAGASLPISAALLLQVTFNTVTMYSPLSVLAVLYIVLMGVQAFTIHGRFDKNWELEEDREALIRDLRLAHEDAVSASRAKSEFLANMSHELRTPLNAIIGFSDIVRTKAFGDAADRYSEYGGFIHQSGHQLLGLIGDILDLAKIQSGRKVLQCEPIDLASLIGDEVRKATEKAALKGLTVVQVPSCHLPLLHADLFSVRQILAHLLSNAVKFTPSGQVDVSATLNADDEIEIAVADTDIGIAAEDQPQIFDRFGKGRPQVTSAHRGSGLGLAIVKGLVELHGGRIALESALGEGTRVTIVFPESCTFERNNRRVA